MRVDHIGRPAFAATSAGTVVWSASYLPFGGGNVSTGAPIDLRFSGQWFQTEAGLYQNWMRDYDPTTGRYIEADPLGLVDGASVYGYARQNPGRWVDPRGEEATLPVSLPQSPWVGVPGGAGGGGALSEIMGTCISRVALPLAILWPTEMGDGTCPAVGCPEIDQSYVETKAPGKPGEEDGFESKKGWDGRKAPNPNGQGYGYPDRNGDVWIPTGSGGSAHGGPHWDVQSPGGGYRNVYRGARCDTSKVDGD